ncbi:hypothetical protein FOL47_008509 [Perkinsus chesapeaki]|uniref:Uncharacterized protein n=1 Tax=Perkinsus chesapeaki TaxID=330153 RepID=A0A7J6MUN5_PERCH|nr:hypothetical protein FOL47_008509 [Perkinsus chesapeaki]
MLYRGTVLPNKEWAETKALRIISRSIDQNYAPQSDRNAAKKESEQIWPPVVGLPSSFDPSFGRAVPPCPTLDDAFRQCTLPFDLVLQGSPELLFLDLNGCACLKSREAVVELLTQPCIGELKELILSRPADLPASEAAKLEKSLPHGRVYWTESHLREAPNFEMVCPLSGGTKKKGKAKKKGTKGGKKKKK